MKKQRGGRRRNRIEKLKLDEVSAVNRPAQEPALAQISKAAEEFDEWLEKYDTDPLEKQIEPREGESREDFIGRFLDAMEDEIPDRRARFRAAARAYERLAKSDFDDGTNVDVEKQIEPREGESRAAFIGRFVRAMEDEIPDRRARFRAAARAYERMAKAGDLVDLFSEEEDGHQHAINIYQSDDGVAFVTGFGANEDGGMHDHQITEVDGNYVMSTNRGHTHEIDQAAIRQAVIGAIMKQGPSRQVRERLAESGEALSDGSFPIRNRSDLRRAISAFGRANRDDRRRVARHIQRRARALDAMDMLPEEGVLADILKSANPLDSEREQMSDNNTQTGNLEKQVETLTAELAVAKSMATLTDAQRTFHAGLPTDEEKSAFLAKSDEDRTSAMESAVAKAAEADPVVYTTIDGTEIRKSADPALLALAKRADKAEQEAIAGRAQLETTRIAKRAVDEFAGLAGSDEVHVAVVKALETIEDAELQKQAFAMVKASNPVGAFKTAGVNASPIQKSAGDKDAANAELTSLAKAHAAENNVNFYEAYDVVSQANPELLRTAMA